jgi:broad specificity phosphatase PhoE
MRVSTDGHHPAPAVLYLVRHGESTANAERRFNAYDTPLSPAGLAQAHRVAERLAAEGPFHALYTSDLTRTLQTAAVIGARLGLRPVPLPALRELDTGDWKGTLYADLEARHPGALQRWIAAGGFERLPGPDGESVCDVRARLTACLEELAARHTGERVIAVSHGWALGILLACVQGLDPHETFRTQQLRLGNTAVSVVEACPGGPRRCLLLGCTAHLDPEPSHPSAAASP